MKVTKWLVAMMTLLTVSVLSVSAQNNDIILQLTIPFFAEDLLQESIDEFEAQNPSIQVQLLPYQGFGLPIQNSDDPEEYQDNVAAYFQSADVLFVDDDLDSEITRGGYVLDLSPLTQSDPNFSDGDFHTTLLDSFYWDMGQWALPISTDFVVMIYDPAAFDAVGLAYPSNNWTLADLEFAARTLTQINADGSIAMPGLIVQGNNSRSALFASLAGQALYSDATIPNDPDFTNPQLDIILDTWVTMEADGLMTLPDDIDNDDVPLRIANPQQGGGRFFNNQDEPDVATALLPGGTAGLDPFGYAISSGTRYPEAAYTLISFLLSDSNAIAVSGGTVPALRNVEVTANQEIPGPGGGFGNIPEEFIPLLNAALENGLPLSEQRYSDGLTTALNLMQSSGYDAPTALDEARNEILTRLVAADNRANAPIVVNEPEIDAELVAGEVELNFAIVGGGRGGGAVNQWQTIADAFVDSDPEVARISVEQIRGFDTAAITENYQCFYSSSNLVPDLDLDTVLSLDPLLFSDPNFDMNDYISGVFQQVQFNGQTWAVPLQITPLVLRINEDAFNQVGVFLPDGSWTVSEFEDALRQLQFAVEDGTMPAELNASAQTSVLTLIAIYGGIPFDTSTDPVTVNFTDEATVAAIQQVLDLIDQDFLAYGQGGGPGGGFGGQNQTTSPIYSNIITAFAEGGDGQNNTDIIIPFPQGTQFNAVPFDLGTAYISANNANPEACYRFISYVSQSTDLFNSMPARYSQINSDRLLSLRGAETVEFYRSLADLMAQPNTILLPNNINAGNFGMTIFLFEVFERYLDGEIIDLVAELSVAQQLTQDFMVCVALVEPPNADEGRTNQAVFQEFQACQQAVSSTGG